MRPLYILIAIFGFSAFAQTLPVLPSAPEIPLELGGGEPTVPCDQVVDRMINYNKMARQHDEAVNQYLEQVSSRLSTWHSILLPLEGKAQSVPLGIFEPLQKGSEEIGVLLGISYDNTTLLAEELDKLIATLRSCL